MKNEFNPIKNLGEKIEKLEQEEQAESITVGRLNELEANITKLKIDSYLNEEYRGDRMGRYFLNDISSLVNEFLEAENKLDSNSKIKLHRRIKEGILIPKIKEITSFLSNELYKANDLVEKITNNIIGDDEKETIGNYLQIPVWQRLDAVGELILVLEKTGFDEKELKEKVSELNKKIEKQEYRTREGELGGYN